MDRPDFNGKRVISEIDNYLIEITMSGQQLDDEFMQHAIDQRVATPDFFEVVEKAYKMADSFYPGKCDILYRAADCNHHIQPWFGYCDEDMYANYERNHDRLYEEYVHGEISIVQRSVRDRSEFNYRALWKKTCIWYRALNAYIVVHFPELEIHNERLQTHTITDLYAAVIISYELTDNGCERLGTISKKTMFSTLLKGLRLSLSQAEINAGYLHSHLPVHLRREPEDDDYYEDEEYDNGEANDFQNFCLGMSDIWDNLVLLRDDPHNEDALIAVFAGLKEHLEFESIQGGPHHLIADIAGSQQKSFPECIDIYHTFVEQILERKPPLNFRFNNGRFHIVDDKLFFAAMNYYDISHQLYYGATHHYGMNAIVVQDSYGKPRMMMEIDNEERNTPDPSFEFQGKWHYMKVTDRVVNPQSFDFNPNLKRYVKEELETILAGKMRSTIPGDVKASEGESNFWLSQTRAIHLQS